jgi:hypothetical protein
MTDNMDARERLFEGICEIACWGCCTPEHMRPETFVAIAETARKLLAAAEELLPDDADPVGPTEDEFDVWVLEMTPEQRWEAVPSVYWKSMRGRAVAALLRAQGKQRSRRPPSGAACWTADELGEMLQVTEEEHNRLGLTLIGVAQKQGAQR